MAPTARKQMKQLFKEKYPKKMKVVEWTNKSKKILKKSRENKLVSKVQKVREDIKNMTKRLTKLFK